MPTTRWRAGVALVGGPADPRVAGALAAGGGGEQEAAEQAGLGGEQVAQLAAGGADGAEGMLASHQGLEEAALAGGVDRGDGQAAQAVNAVGHSRDGRHGRGVRRRRLPPLAGPGGGQGDEAGLVEGDEGGQAAAAAGLAGGIQKAEGAADGEGGGPAGGRGLGVEQAAQAVEVGRLQQSGANRHRGVHTGSMHKS